MFSGHHERPFCRADRAKATLDECHGTVGTGVGLAIFADQRPAVEIVARDEVGDAQGFDRAGKGDVREIPEQQEDKPGGLCHGGPAQEKG
jgi:hypothetical protein